MPPRFKEIGRPLATLAVHILRQLAAHAQREQDLPILVALPLDNPQVTGMQIDIREAELHEFGIPQPRHEEQFEHDYVGELLRRSHRVIERDSFRLREQGR